MEREDFIEIKEESFGTPIFTAPQSHQRVEFIIKKS